MFEISSSLTCLMEVYFPSRCFTLVLSSTNFLLKLVWLCDFEFPAEAARLIHLLQLDRGKCKVGHRLVPEVITQRSRQTSFIFTAY